MYADPLAVYIMPTGEIIVTFGLAIGALFLIALTSGARLMDSCCIKRKKFERIEFLLEQILVSRANQQRPPNFFVNVQEDPA